MSRSKSPQQVPRVPAWKKEAKEVVPRVTFEVARKHDEKGEAQAVAEGSVPRPEVEPIKGAKPEKPPVPEKGKGGRREKGKGKGKWKSWRKEKKKAWENRQDGELKSAAETPQGRKVSWESS